MPTGSDFRLDELARALKKHGLNSFTRETFRQLCRDESILAEAVAAAADSYLPVAVRSFRARVGHRGCVAGEYASADRLVPAAISP